MRGPCAKRRTVCVIYPATMHEPIKGENDCCNPQPVCPRLPGEGYAKCITICQQEGHAEDVALEKAKSKKIDLSGAIAVIKGHYYICEPCGRKLQAAGVKEIRIFNKSIPNDEEVTVYG